MNKTDRGSVRPLMLAQGYAGSQLGPRVSPRRRCVCAREPERVAPRSVSFRCRAADSGCLGLARQPGGTCGNVAIAAVPTAAPGGWRGIRLPPGRRKLGRAVPSPVVKNVRPARIELATLGLGVPCSIQFELRARMVFSLFDTGLRRHRDPLASQQTIDGCHSVAVSRRTGHRASQF
jgi:hypothetical protein